MNTENPAAIAERARARYTALYERGEMPDLEYRRLIALSRLACGTMSRNNFDIGTRAALDAIAAVGHILTLHRNTYAVTPAGRAALMDVLRTAAEWEEPYTGE